MDSMPDAALKRPDRGHHLQEDTAARSQALKTDALLNQEREPCCLVQNMIGQNTEPFLLTVCTSRLPIKRALMPSLEVYSLEIIMPSSLRQFGFWNLALVCPGTIWTTITCHCLKWHILELISCSAKGNVSTRANIISELRVASQAHGHKRLLEAHFSREKTPHWGPAATGLQPDPSASAYSGIYRYVPACTWLL